ncbi:acetyltransferase, GNAT family protein [Agrocybe pediades]|nr:acetyltransferase, GNAT family protein [Agrocybe pediades]
MHQTEIWTERLLLRAAESNDLDAFRKWFQDPESMNYWSTPPHTDIEQTKNFLANMIGSPQNGVLDFVVCLQGSDPTTPTSSTSMTVIGKAGLYDGQEIGFMFDRDYWGKGYAFEALDAIVKHYWAVKEDQPDAVIKADVDPRNTKSLRLLHKLGFVEVGTAKNTFETHLGWCDSVYLEARRSA